MDRLSGLIEGDFEQESHRSGRAGTNDDDARHERDRPPQPVDFED